MANLVISGDTSGSVTLAAPAVSGTTVLTLPTTSGTLVTTAGGSTVPFALGSAAAPSITFTGDTNTGMFSPGADTIAFSEGGVESMRIDSSGNVGIGTSSPNIASGFTNLVVSDTDNGGIIYVDRAGGARGYFYANGTSSVVLGNTTSIPLVFNTADTERMRITAAGDIAINGSSYTSLGKVSVTIPNNSSSFFSTNAANADFQVTHNSNLTTLGTTAGALAIKAANFEYMRIDTAGKVSIGTTVSSVNSTYVIGGGLTVAGAAANTNTGVQWQNVFLSLTNTDRTTNNLTGLGFDGRNSTGDLRGLGWVGMQTTSWTDNAISSNMLFYTSNSGSVAERIRIDSFGNLLVGVTSRANGSWNGGYIQSIGYAARSGVGGSFSGNAFNLNWTGNLQAWVDTTNLGTIAFSSDYRIKRNVKTQTVPALERVMQLRPVTYQMADYGDLFKASDDIKEGFIAHEVQEVIPSGADGEKDDENQIQSLKLDAILAVAVKAIQEQQALITQLQADVAALKGAK
jgi:hypothetical protein